MPTEICGVHAFGDGAVFSGWAASVCLMHDQSVAHVHHMQASPGCHNCQDMYSCWALCMTVCNELNCRSNRQPGLLRRCWCIHRLLVCMCVWGLIRGIFHLCCAT